MLANIEAIRGGAALDTAAAVRAWTAPPGRARGDIAVHPRSEQWDERLRAFHARKRVASVWAWDLADCVVFPPYMIVVDASGRVVRQTVRDTSFLSCVPALRGLSREKLNAFIAQETAEFQVELPAGLDTIEAPCVLLGSTQPFEYFRWLVELAPKLDLVREDLRARRLVVPQFRHAYQSESLSYFGVEPQACIALSKPARFRNLRVLSNVATASLHLSAFVDLFFKPYSGRRTRRLYVAVKDAAIALDAEALGFLFHRRGFELVAPEALSFAERAELFRNADVVVAPQCEALADIAFAASGARVIELVPQQGAVAVSCYAALSDERSLRHTMLRRGSARRGEEADARVEARELERILW